MCDTLLLLRNQPATTAMLLSAGRAANAGARAVREPLGSVPDVHGEHSHDGALLNPTSKPDCAINCTARCTDEACCVMCCHRHITAHHSGARNMRDIHMHRTHA